MKSKTSAISWIWLIIRIIVLGISLAFSFTYFVVILSLWVVWFIFKMARI